MTEPDRARYNAGFGRREPGRQDRNLSECRVAGNAIETSKRDTGVGRLITALGIAQICSWGTLYYSFALMAEAMRLACDAGRKAYLAGRMPKRDYANASSPTAGLIE